MAVKAPIIDFEKSLGPWLGRTMKMVDLHLQEAFNATKIDITKEQMIVLKRLQGQDGMNQNELASQTYRDKSSLARLLSKMEAKGYIKREKGKIDKRNKRVFLTSHGIEVFESTRPVIKEVMDTMEYGISEPDKEMVIEALKQIQTNFTKKLATK
jgi:DNA-binding MarR family transcriptional regulator